VLKMVQKCYQLFCITVFLVYNLAHFLFDPLQRICHDGHSRNYSKHLRYSWAHVWQPIFDAIMKNLLLQNNMVKFCQNIHFNIGILSWNFVQLIFQFTNKFLNFFHIGFAWYWFSSCIFQLHFNRKDLKCCVFYFKDYRVICLI